MGCCKSCCSARRYDGEREPIIQPKDARSIVSVSELRCQVNKYNIKIKTLKEQLRKSQIKLEEKQRNADRQEVKIMQFKSALTEFEKLVEELKRETQSLITRLSEISLLMCANDNHTTADLSDHNVPYESFGVC